MIFPPFSGFTDIVTLEVLRNLRQADAYSHITLEALDVTYRTYSRLKHAGLITVADLLNLMRTDLPAFLSIRGIGKKSVAEVLLKLKEIGIDVDDLIGRLDLK